jgi:unsaturated rhamnogalacturonyl hydrolase
LDDDTSYEEVSGSAAITAGLLRGMKLGILGEEYKETCDKAVAGICDNIANDGTVLGVSAGTGMGMNPEHYKAIQTRPMAYGQALTLIALCEALG